MPDGDRNWLAALAGAERYLARSERRYMEKDGGGPIDPGIRPLLVLLNALGFRTTGSCEGHGGSDTFVVCWIPAARRTLWEKYVGKLFCSLPLPIHTDLVVSARGSIHWPDVPSVRGFVVGISYGNGPGATLDPKETRRRVLADWIGITEEFARSIRSGEIEGGRDRCS